MPTTDIVARLTAAIEHPETEFPPNNWAGKIADLFRDAKAEIERLRALAGAVSDGKSFAEIAGRQTVQFEDEGPKGF